MKRGAYEKLDLVVTPRGYPLDADTGLRITSDPKLTLLA